MNRTPVVSSSIISLGYDKSLWTIEAEFNTHAVWRYHNISPQRYRALMNADSLGTYFSEHISMPGVFPNPHCPIQIMAPPKAKPIPHEVQKERLEQSLKESLKFVRKSKKGVPRGTSRKGVR